MVRNDELPGIYFSETVTDLDAEISYENMICFILQTSAEIPALDNQLVLQTSYDAFKTICTGKGLDKTLDYINTILELTNTTQFYTYSIKTDTPAGFKEAVNCSDHIKEIRKIIYFEETASTQSNTITQKMNALTTACHECYTYGAFRTAYVVPYATIEKALTDAEEGTPVNTTIINTFSTMLNTLGDGRLNVLLPDSYANIMATCIATPFYQDPGRDNILGDVQLKYKFNRQEMKQLMNMGVLFIREFRTAEGTQYKITSGVNTGYKENKADGVISARAIADELLHDADIAMENHINNESNVAFVQASVDGVITDYSDNGYVIKAQTNLTVADAGNMKFTVSGQITTVKPLKIIEVNTTIN